MGKKYLWYWGGNFNIENLPVSSGSNEKYLPHLIDTVRSWKHITINKNGAHGITEDGDLYGWGWDCAYTDVPTKRPPYYRTVWYCKSLTGKGRIKCPNRAGLIKYGLITKPESKWKDVSRGFYHVAAIAESGRLYSWGVNGDGELGRGRLIERGGRLKKGQVISYKGWRFSPVEIITGGNDWSKVVCGSTWSAALKEDGSLWYWPTNNGRGCNDCLPPSCKGQYCGPKKIGDSFKSIISNSESSHSGYGLKKDGTISIFPNNVGESRPENTSVLTQLGDGWKQIAYNWYGTGGGGVKEDGTLWCWGPNYWGELGINKDKYEVEFSSVPVQTTLGGNDWKSVFTGGSYNTKYAIKNDGTLWGWGGNSFFTVGIEGWPNYEVREPTEIKKNSVGWKTICCTGSEGALAIKEEIA
jgi:alpha-tubulin suppressor-like RCC1 family protein